MQFELKPISKDALPEALQKAERYRLLNEPWQAESICLDVLRIDPENQRALVTVLLSLTDQFGNGAGAAQAREILSRLRGAYERAYYAGIIWERLALAQLERGAPGSVFDAFEMLREAMQRYEEAEAIRPAGNDDAILRWNTCARMLMRDQNLRPRPEGAFEPILGE